ncbi:unnamed protein product [Alternaria alternata]
MAPSWRMLSSFTFSLAALFSVQPSLVGAQCDIPPLTLTWANLSVTQDGLGVARGIELGIGTPHQIFAFRPSTTLNNTRINNIDDEDDTGGYVYFNDDVAFQENGHVDGFPLVMDQRGIQSGLPLGTNSSFLRAAVAGRVAPSQVFGLWSSSRGIDPHDGLLVVGGYDRARVDPASSFTTFPIGEWSLERACPLQVTVTNLTYQDRPLIPDGSDELIACIEPSTQRFVFPPAIAQAFGVYTGQNETAYPGKMHYNVSNRPMGDLVVTLAGGYQSTIPIRSCSRHYVGLISTVVMPSPTTARSKPRYLIPEQATQGILPKSELKLAPAVAADAKDVAGPYGDLHAYQHDAGESYSNT